MDDADLDFVGRGAVREDRDGRVGGPEERACAVADLGPHHVPVPGVDAARVVGERVRDRDVAAPRADRLLGQRDRGRVGETHVQQADRDDGVGRERDALEVRDGARQCGVGPRGHGLNGGAADGGEEKRQQQEAHGDEGTARRESSVSNVRPPVSMSRAEESRVEPHATPLRSGRASVRYSDAPPARADGASTNRGTATSERTRGPRRSSRGRPGR